MQLSENSSFSKKLPGLQLAWDSTSLGALKKCARYYELAIKEGWRSNESSIDLDFGIWLHSGCEHYDHARAQGRTHEEGVDAALNYVLSATWDERTQRPWRGDSNKNRFTLARTIVWYLDQFEFDPLETIQLSNGKPAVEVSFRFPLGFGPTTSLPYDSATDEGGDSEEFLLCGHLDKVVSFQGRLWIADKKTTRRTLDQWYFGQYSPDNQMSCYSIAGQVVLREKIAGIIIDGMQILVEGTRFMRGLVERSQDQLNEFMRGLHYYLRQAEKHARDNFWPMNEKACFRCEFREICASAPSVREAKLRSDFTKRIWDPLRVRGDI